MKKTHRITLAVIFWMASVACMALIYMFSAQSGDASQELSDGIALSFLGQAGEWVFAVIRKMAHFAEFAALSVCLFLALWFTCGRIKIFLPFFLTAIYAVSDEIHQLFVEGRACRVFDVFIDCLGAASGLAVIYMIFVIFKLHRRNFK